MQAVIEILLDMLIYYMNTSQI